MLFPRCVLTHVVTLAVLAVTITTPSLADEDPKTWNDDRQTVLDRLDALVTEMNRGKDAVAAGNIQQTFAEAAQLLEETLPTEQQMEDFNNGGCAAFKDDLAVLFGALLALGNELAGFHDFAFELQVQDPGLVGLIPKIPCGMLLPVFLVNDRLGLIDEDLNDTLIAAPDQVALLRDVVYPPETLSVPQGVFTLLSMGSPDTLDTPAVANSCPVIRANAVRVTRAHQAVRGVGYSSLALGTLLQVVGKSAVAGPDEVQVEIWGWVGSRIRNTPAMMAGKFFTGVGHALTGISGAVSRTRVYCALRDDHALLAAQNRRLKDGQDEIIRLLLTPQGRRSSSFCHDQACSVQDFPVRPRRE